MFLLNSLFISVYSRDPAHVLMIPNSQPKASNIGRLSRPSPPLSPVASHETSLSWTALTEFHVCAASEGENNALFGGVRAFSKELQDLTGEVCATPQLLTPTKVTAHGGENNINALFDGIFETRWTTLETMDENDLQNGKITMHFYGDQRVSRVRMSFFDGDLARQHFSLYKQSAAETSWTPVLEHQMAERTENYQNFEIQETGVNKLYVVANGNDIGAYTKISELQAWGC